MKKNVLNQIEKIKKERKISDDIQKKIRDRAIVNGAIGISLVMLIATYLMSANLLPSEWTKILYNVSSIVFLTFTIIVFEIGYKKDSGKLAISGVELLVVAIFILFGPYIFLRFNYTIIYGAIITILIYYTIKIIRIYHLEKSNYIKTIDDIQEIIKKESKDELAKEYEAKRQKEIEKKQRKSKSVKNTKKTAKTKKETPKKKTQVKKNQSDKNLKTDNKKDSETTVKKTNKTTPKKTSTKKTASKTKNNTKVKENK